MRHNLKNYQTPLRGLTLLSGRAEKWLCLFGFYNVFIQVVNLGVFDLNVAEGRPWG